MKITIDLSKKNLIKKLNFFAMVFSFFLSSSFYVEGEYYNSFNHSQKNNGFLYTPRDYFIPGHGAVNGFSKVLIETIWQLNNDFKSVMVSNSKFSYHYSHFILGRSMRKVIKPSIVPETLSSSEKKFYQFKKISPAFKLGKKAIPFRSLENKYKHEVDQIVLSALPRSFKRKGAKKYIRPAIELALKNQIDPFWALAVMWTESAFNEKALSHVGASGLMQIMPGTQRDLVREIKRENVVLEFRNFDYLKKRNVLNMELGTYFLKDLKDRFNGNEVLATVAYNMGPYWVKKRLKRKLSVATSKNKYLKKVRERYSKLAHKFI